MSILGVVVRARPQDMDAVTQRLGQLPGVDVALNPGDGRVVLVIEDGSTPPPGEAEPLSAAATLGRIATWPEVLNTSLVYEYSGPDSPAPESAQDLDYRAWRDGLSGQGARTSRRATDPT